VGAAAWVWRWAQLTDPPEQPSARSCRGRHGVRARLEHVAAELGATSADVTDAHTDGDQVLAVFELRKVRTGVFLDRKEALCVKKNGEQHRRLTRRVRHGRLRP
jgi:ketosteroid isomerase-like protein